MQNSISTINAKESTLYKTYSFAYAKYIVLRKYMVLQEAASA